MSATIRTDRTNVYRNLLKSKQLDKTGKRYVYSYTQAKGSDGLTKGLIDTSMGDKGYEYGTAYLAGPVIPVFLRSRQQAVRDSGTREVFAWLSVGKPAIEPSGMTARRISLNPWTDDEYKYSDDGQIVAVDRCAGVRITPDGVYVITN